MSDNYVRIKTEYVVQQLVEHITAILNQRRTKVATEYDLWLFLQDKIESAEITRIINLAVEQGFLATVSPDNYTLPLEKFMGDVQ